MRKLASAWETLSHAVMLKAWWLLLSVAVWVRVKADKAKLSLPPVLDYLLLSEVEIEDRIANFLQLIDVATAGDGISMLGSSELTLQREVHDEVDDEGDLVAVEEEFVPTVLTFYVASEMPDTLAIARYTALDEESQIMLVNEDVYKDNPEELVRLESDVHDCLMEGIDVSVLSHHDLETFPYIEGIINDTAD